MNTAVAQLYRLWITGNTGSASVSLQTFAERQKTYLFDLP